MLPDDDLLSRLVIFIRIFPSLLRAPPSSTEKRDRVVRPLMLGNNVAQRPMNRLVYEIVST